MSIHSGLFVFFLLVLVGFTAGYLFRTNQETDNMIKEQRAFLEHQLVVIDGKLYRANRTTKTLRLCQIMKTETSGIAAQYTCGERVKVLEN